MKKNRKKVFMMKYSSRKNKRSTATSIKSNLSNQRSTNNPIPLVIIIYEYRISLVIRKPPTLNIIKNIGKGISLLLRYKDFIDSLMENF